MKTSTLRFLCSAACLAVFAAGCSSEVTEKPAVPQATSVGKKVDTATAGSITGQVKFEGTVPPARLIPMGDPQCVPDGAPISNNRSWWMRTRAC